MTNEELELALKETNEKINQFGPENKLANKDWRQLQHFKREKELLENIQKARENGSSSREAKNMMQYNLMKEDNKMNPFLRYIMQLKLRSQMWW